MIRDASLENSQTKEQAKKNQKKFNNLVNHAKNTLKRNQSINKNHTYYNASYLPNM